MMNSRVTQSSISSIALRGLQASLTRVQDLQESLSSGRQIQNASDDPSGTATAMTLRSQLIGQEQFLRNADAAVSRLNVTDTALADLSTQLQNVRNLMVQSQSGAISNDARAALSAQVSNLRGDIINLYNTTYLDRPVFGGTVPGQQAVDPATGAYIGNDAPLTVRISADTALRFDVKGTDVAADAVPAVLDQIATNIGSTGVTQTDFDALDDALGKIIRAMGDVGARTSRIETTKSNVETAQVDTKGRISNVEDIDLPEAIMKLSAQQVGYQAALNTASKILQQSLVDFLR